LKLKTRVLGAVSTLALAGGMVAIAAPAATAAPTVIGSCGGQVGLATLTPAITDQTQLNVVIKTKLLKDVTTKTAISGDCSSASRPGDPINPAGGLVTPLTPKAVAASLLGNTGCASGATAQAVDATAAAQWSPNGKITFTMTQFNALAKPWQIQGDIAFLGADPSQPTGDVINVGGIVLKGAAVGATISGGIWQAPATLLPKGDPGQPGVYNTGYGLDLASALGCADNTPNNATIGTTLFGGGGSSATSPLGSTASGLIFSLGQ
jgi:hypothetical protein